MLTLEPCFFLKCKKRHFAERLQKPTRTASGSTDGSKSSMLRGWREGRRQGRAQGYAAGAVKNKTPLSMCDYLKSYFHLFLEEQYHPNHRCLDHFFCWLNPHGYGCDPKSGIKNHEYLRSPEGDSHQINLSKYKLFAASSCGISLDVVHVYIQTNIDIDVIFTHHIRHHCPEIPSLHEVQRLSSNAGACLLHHHLSW